MLTDYSFDIESNVSSPERADLQQLSFDIQGFRYRAAPPEKSAADAVLLLPKAESILYRNSFMPEIRICKDDAADCARYHVNCRLQPSVRAFIRFFLVFACIIQVILLISFLAKRTLTFAAFFPLLIVLFVFLLTHFAGAAIKKSLVDILEERLSGRLSSSER